MNVRPATLADVPTIVTLVGDYARRGEVLPRSAEEIQETLADWVVGEKMGQVLACGSLLRYTPRLAEVRSLVVHGSAKGIGERGGESADCSGPTPKYPNPLCPHSRRAIFPKAELCPQ